jgi:hypothetical protein
MLTKAEKNMSIMAHSGIWTDLKYVAVVGDTMVKANIPQKTLESEPFTPYKVIPREVVALLRNPSPESKMKLRAIYGVTVEYIPVVSAGDSVRKEAA